MAAGCKQDSFSVATSLGDVASDRPFQAEAVGFPYMSERKLGDMPKVVKMPENLPSSVVDELGLNQDGYYGRDELGLEAEWDQEGVEAVCMLGGVFRGYALDSDLFGADRGVLEVVRDESPAAMEYLSVLGEVIERKLRDYPGLERIEDPEDVMDLVSSFSDNLEEVEIAFQVLVECEVGLGLRPESDLELIWR